MFLLTHLSPTHHPVLMMKLLLVAKLVKTQKFGGSVQEHLLRESISLSCKPLLLKHLSPAELQFLQNDTALPPFSCPAVLCWLLKDCKNPKIPSTGVWHRSTAMQTALKKRARTLDRLKAGQRRNSRAVHGIPFQVLLPLSSAQVACGLQEIKQQSHPSKRLLCEHVPKLDSEIQGQENPT